MTSHVLRAPQTIGFGARRLAYIAIGLVAVALVVAALASSGGTSTVSGSAVTSGRAVAVTHDEDYTLPPGSGVSLGRAPGIGRVPGKAVETNLLPK